ncbi:hypothetical protein M3Y99_01196700 [Aphelenchoides fujianensis]|nr:hypothetical protein M3Y99_01196700 [Aphelenchoides fujianensis]
MSAQLPHFFVLAFFFLLQTTRIDGQVRVSSDLNCDFSDNCRWHNGTGLPEVFGWAHTNDIMPDSRFPVGLPDKGKPLRFLQPDVHFIGQDLVSIL